MITPPKSRRQAAQTSKLPQRLSSHSSRLSCAPRATNIIFDLASKFSQLFSHWRWRIGGFSNEIILKLLSLLPAIKVDSNLFLIRRNETRLLSWENWTVYGKVGEAVETFNRRAEPSYNETENSDDFALRLLGNHNWHETRPKIYLTRLEGFRRVAFSYSRTILSPQWAFWCLSNGRDVSWTGGKGRFEYPRRLFASTATESRRDSFSIAKVCPF